MNDLLRRMSQTLGEVQWEMSAQTETLSRRRFTPLSKRDWRVPKERQKAVHRRIIRKFERLIKDDWPLAEKLREMVRTWDDRERSVGAHVVAVLASVNALLPGAFDANEFLISSESDPGRFDEQVRDLAREAHNKCWVKQEPSPLVERPPATPPYFGSGDEDREFAQGFLRIAALYHDMGLTISTDHHGTRGVHLMRDMDVADRLAVERLFPDIWDKRRFWALLAHHDVFGVLCTGEASLPALVDMVGWTSERQADITSGQSTLAQISLLCWLNIADSNARLIRPLGGITTVEAYRYLADWYLVQEFLLSGMSDPWRPMKRDEFKSWAFEVGSRPDKTILRISRLIATCYRLVKGSIDYETEQRIKELVEEELQASHGPRFERFCHRFSRFCKLDYGLRFFELLMRDAFEGADPSTTSEHDEDNQEPRQAEQRSLRTMVARTCAILHRIVDEYGHLVEGDRHAVLRVGVDMSKLTSPGETGKAICNSLKKSEAGALRWIIDEISIWLYGD